MKNLIKKCNNIHRIALWGYMDLIVNNINNFKIRKYWKENGTPYPFIYYKDLKVNPYWFEKYFDRYTFEHRCLGAFRHCIDMCLDNDIEEYLNSLEAIKNNKKK